jgi:ribA/ribD-fused uncharacterized protein
VIDRFAGEHAFLSNFHASPIRLELFDQWWTFATGEHAFQVGKAVASTWDAARKLEWVEKMAASTTPNEAKRMGRSIAIDKPYWDRISIIVMKRVQELKYEQNFDLRSQLMATWKDDLVEGNTWGDTLWGQVDGVGANQLGIILMELRSRLLFERLIDASWVLLVEQQGNATPGWSMSKTWASTDLREAFEPFRNDEHDSYDIAKIRAMVKSAT